MNKIQTTTSEETFQVAVSFAKNLKGNEIIAFFGDLGTGKTTFIKGLISTLSPCQPEEVTSPTFNYLHTYEGPIYHFDLYRLRSAEEFQKAGFSEYLQGDGICCIEWSERIENILPPKTIRIEIRHIGDDKREIFFHES